MLYTGFLLPFLSNKRKTLQKDNYEKIKKSVSQLPEYFYI
jgi:hypothetical protein